MCFYKAIVKSMFKQVASRNGSLDFNTAKLFSNPGSQISNVKHID